jgi:hypothetical protein
MKVKLIIRHVLWAFLTVYFSITSPIIFGSRELHSTKHWSFLALVAIGTAILAFITYSNRDKSKD